MNHVLILRPKSAPPRPGSGSAMGPQASGTTGTGTGPSRTPVIGFNVNDARTTLFLVRHAKAEDRAAWVGDDAQRPLTRKGRRQALLLAEALGGEPISRVISSPARRCVDTVEPLAAALGIGLEVDDTLAEGHDFDPPHDQGTFVMCAHGDNIPALLARLDVEFEECRKGSIWRLELGGDGRVAHAEYIPPPPTAEP